MTRQTTVRSTRAAAASKAIAARQTSDLAGSNIGCGTGRSHFWSQAKGGNRGNGRHRRKKGVKRVTPIGVGWASPVPKEGSDRQSLQNRKWPFELEGWSLLPFLALIWPTLLGRRSLVRIGHSQKSDQNRGGSFELQKWCLLPFLALIWPPRSVVGVWSGSVTRRNLVKYAEIW